MQPVLSLCQGRGAARVQERAAFLLGEAEKVEGKGVMDWEIVRIFAVGTKRRMLWGSLLIHSRTWVLSGYSDRKSTRIC